MEKKFIIGLIVLTVLLSGCNDGPIPSSYKLVLPVLPGGWTGILGEPHWRFEWIGEDGNWRKMDITPGSETPGLSLLSEWTTPVLAWPFWPAWDMFPGTMRPAGALFPWDAMPEGAGGGSRLSLSWKGGVDAVFWQELAAAESAVDADERRIPWLFDWPRFRELFESDTLPEAVRQDPWLVDWKDVSKRTIQSGFDRRRIVSRKFQEMIIPDLDGTWIGSSPFALPLEADPDGQLYLNAADTPDTWVSEIGVLKCSTLGYVFIAR